MGTRFWLFPQTPTNEHSLPAEQVELSPPAGTVGPGPEDETIYVLFPVKKDKEYGMHEDRFGEEYVYLPPWDGSVFEEAQPDEEGHFLHYQDINDARFHAAHIYASIRFTLDVWESYFEKPITWHFSQHFEKCEVNLLPNFDNAIIGYGFVEIGTHVDKQDGSLSPFSLNFDVIAHEVGHGIVYAEVGMPQPKQESPEYLGFQESSADIVSMVAALHFESILDEVLESTSGNLYMHNHLNRFAETSSSKQIRMACNEMKLSNFSKGWRDEHLLAQPLTGAVFDILVDIFHEELVRAGAISTSLEEASDRLEGSDDYGKLLQGEFDNAYAETPEAFRDALIFARDCLAVLMVETWSRLKADELEYLDVLRAMREVDAQVFYGRYRTIIEVNFAWREIGIAIVGPRLPKKKGDPESHTHSNRTLMINDTFIDRGSYRERYFSPKNGV